MSDDRGKYLITARLEANGVIQRSDVVGAVFGQTEGLLGDRLDLRTLQESERVGRLEVDVTSEDGRSTGEIAIRTNLDRPETAILAAALETIEQIGPCRATVEVTAIDDVRAAKRREVVDRAKELLAVGFKDAGLSSREVIEEVRADAGVSQITEYDGHPAGPAVERSDSVILVEGRADVRRLLEFGIDNAIGVEGTDVPDAIVDLTEDRVVTAFFDGDRGGNLLLLELAQVGDVDYVTFAPPGTAVEDLSRSEVHSALQERVPYEDVEDTEVTASADDEAEPRVPEPPAPAADSEPAADEDKGEGEDEDTDGLQTLEEHVHAVIGAGDVRMRAVDGTYEIVADREGTDVQALLTELPEPPYALIVDGEVPQAAVDAAARVGVDHLIATELGEFTKRPVDVRVHAATDVVPELDVDLPA